MSHNLKVAHGVKICQSCGAAFWRSGYWYFAGYKSKEEPLCDVDLKEWIKNAEENTL